MFDSRFTIANILALIFCALAARPLLAWQTIDPNESLTVYVWLPDSTDPMKGECYEIDQKTRGEKFNTKVYTSRCRPKKPGFKWVPGADGMSGTCYEVDPSSGAQGFSYKVSARECIPDNAEFILVEGQCYAKGIMKDGTEILTKTILDDCKPKNIEYEFKFDAKQMRGDCIGKDPSGASSYVRRVELSRCRPKQTTYLYDDARNKCYEVDPVSGPEGYFNNAALTRCLDKKSATYAFIDGKCMEKSLGPEGQEVILDTKLDNCKPSSTQYKFEFKTQYHGDCFEVDALTLGEQYKGRVDVKFCRPPKTVRFYVPGLRQCVEIDEETRGQKFAVRTRDSECEEFVSGPKWVSSEKDIYEGKCMMKLRKATGVVVDAAVLDEKCRPEEIRYDWIQSEEFQGKCYEVDRKQGPGIYSHKVNTRQCYPNPQKLVYRQDPTSLAGRCLIVDSETEGKRFTLQVNARRCKDDMGLISPAP